MGKINYIKHHKNANIKLTELGMSATNKALYNALFLIWNNANFVKTLSVNRNGVMSLAGVGSHTTYTKGLRELHKHKFIDYKPSKNPLIGSLITMSRFDNVNDIDMTMYNNSSDIVVTEQCKSSVPLYKPLNLINLLTYKPINKEEEDFFSKKTVYIKNDENEKDYIFVANQDLPIVDVKEDKKEIPTNGAIEILNTLDSKKEEKKKVAAKKEKKELIYPFDDKEFLDKWALWKLYRKEIKKPIRGNIAEQSALNKISKLSKGSLNDALLIIEQSMENNWTGLFEIKTIEKKKLDRHKVYDYDKAEEEAEF